MIARFVDSLETEPFRQSDRRFVLRRNDRPDRRGGKVISRPLESGLASFRRHSLPMELGIQYPSHLRLFAEFRLEIAPRSEEADVTDELAVALPLDPPGSKAVELPHAGRRSQAAPAIFGTHRVGAEVLMDLGMAYNDVVRAEIILPPMTQDEPFRLDPRRFADQAYFLPRV